MSEIIEQPRLHRSSFVMPRTRGGLTGLGLALLGAWGAVIPFVGPYFDYAFTPNTTWDWTAARGYLQVLPGAAAFLAGLILLGSAHRVTATMAGWLAVAAGAWFVIGPLVAPLWRSDYLGTPVGNATDASLEQIGMFYGLGAAIVLLAGIAVGRFSLRAAEPAPYAATSSSAAPAPVVQRTEFNNDTDRTEPAPEAGRHGWGRRRRFVAH